MEYLVSEQLIYHTVIFYLGGYLNLGQVNMIDINTYLKSFNAPHIYTPNFLSRDSVKVSKGAYAIMDEFQKDVMTAYSAKVT